MFIILFDKWYHIITLVFLFMFDYSLEINITTLTKNNLVIWSNLYQRRCRPKFKVNDILCFSEEKKNKVHLDV